MIVYEFYGRIGVYDLYAPVFFGFDIDVSVFYDDVYVQIVIRPSVEVDADVAVPERLLDVYKRQPFLMPRASLWR